MYPSFFSRFGSEGGPSTAHVDMDDEFNFKVLNEQRGQSFPDYDTLTCHALKVDEKLLPRRSLDSMRGRPKTSALMHNKSY